MHKSTLLGIAAAFMLSAGAALAGPVDIVVNPQPQAYPYTCQSYSMALALSFQSGFANQPTTPSELRDLEELIRSKVQESADTHGGEPNHDDWAYAVDKVTSGSFKLVTKNYTHIDPMMRDIATLTGTSSPKTIGDIMSVVLVKTPVFLSFTEIDGDTYSSGHIVTVFGVEIPPQSMGDDATPDLLLTNSAVKYKLDDAIEKNFCDANSPPTSGNYSAITTITHDWTLKYKSLFYIAPNQ